MRAPNVAGRIAPERRLGSNAIPPVIGSPAASSARPATRAVFARTSEKSARRSCAGARTIDWLWAASVVPGKNVEP